MERERLAELSLYPEDRGCKAPTAARILDIFTGLARHRLLDANGQLVQTLPSQLNALELKVLDLLGVPASVYAA